MTSHAGWVEHKVEFLKDPNDVYECVVAFYFFRRTKEELDQVILVILKKVNYWFLSRLSKKDIERFQSGVVKVRLINARSSSYLKKYSQKSLILFLRYNKVVFSFSLIYFEHQSL